MANVQKKLSISYELARKMVDAAVAEARELGVRENVAIIDDGGNLTAFGRMDGAPILSTEIAQNKAFTALFGVSTGFFQLYPGRSIAFGRHPDARACGGVWRRVSHQGAGRNCRSDRGE